ncbi:MAG: hypothetical protein ABI882_04585, partial [Acidobacteriota bacterium]
MKRILLSVCLAFVPFSLAFAQTDELAISQITNLLNSSGTTVRGASYDGNRIVFESQVDYVGTNTDFNNEIFVYDLPSRRIIQITDTKNITDPDDATKITLNVRNTTPMISGDGTSIVFSSNATLTASNNDDGNQEIFLAKLPLNATTATFLRITNTGTNTGDEVIKEIFTNYSPDLNGDGTIVAFLSTRRTFLALDNGTAQFTASLEGPNRDQTPDGNAEMFLYNVTTKTYSQVTISRDVDAMVGFEVKGFNAVPHLSGNGQVLAFISGFNYPGTNSGNNADFNGEIFVYRRGDPANTFRQLTTTTGPPAVPDAGAMNLLPAFTRPLDSAGTMLVFESAGDFAGRNTDKTREVFLADLSGAQPAFRQITDQTTPSILTSDFNFLASINGAGTFITFGSVINLVPTETHSITTDNADGSRDLFMYDIAGSTATVPKFRQLTFTAVPSFLLDPRQAANFSFADNTGKLITFDYVAFLLADNLSFVTEIFQERLLPITTKNPVAVTLANAASFDAAQLARGSIAAAFGTMLSNSIASAETVILPEEINGVRLTLGTLAAGLIFVSPGQINFVIPEGIAEGTEVPFSINNNGVQSVGTVKIVTVSPGVFSITGDGTGEARAQCGAIVDVVVGDTTTQEFVITEQPCDVGTETLANYLIIYGTGWRFQGGTTVTIGGETLTPVFAGAQPNFPGLDQINLVLTQTLKGKGTVDVI